jgi:1-acyl-sn-glycerol-3-phosphate acyltransferase
MLVSINRNERKSTMNAIQTLSSRTPFPRPSSGRLAGQAWYQAGRLGFAALQSILYDLDVQVQAPIPCGAKLLCSNHPTTIDPVMMTTLVPEPVSILISETLFKVPVLGPSLAAGGHIRVVHANGRPALEEGIRRLRAGRTVGIFPEGAISPEAGGLAHAHTGAARMALASGRPLIPIGIALEPEKIWRVETVVAGQVEVGTWYLHGPYAITVGEAMRFAGDPQDRDLVRAVTGQIVERIADLSRQGERRLAAGAPARPASRPIDRRRDLGWTG